MLWSINSKYLMGPSRDSRNSKITVKRPLKSISGSSKASKFNAAPNNLSESLECTTKLYNHFLLLYIFEI